MSRRLSWLLVSSILVFSSIIIVGCFEGPAGLDGEDGENGNDGVDANATCILCHDHDQVIVAKDREWKTSGHSEGTSFDDAGERETCMLCHNGAGFKQIVTGHEVTDEILNNVTNINCRTCHNIHTSYDTTDWELSTVKAVKLIIDSTAVTDMGKGNLCAVCHQTRNNPMIAETGDSVNISNTHWGPHHGSQTNIIMGKGGYEVAGTVKKANSPHGAMVTDGCVQCHMSTKNHNLNPLVTGCNTSGCHSDLKDFDYDDVQTDVAALLAEAQDSLVAGECYRD